MYFDLTGNLLIAGTIPEALYDSTMLQELLLSQKKFTGTISTGLGKLVDLEKMKLDTNILTGVITTEMGAIKKDEISELEGQPHRGGLSSLKLVISNCWKPWSSIRTS